MPLILPDTLPAVDTLREENIFVMKTGQASHQDIRPLRILILNLMPLKIKTEKHLLRMLSNSPLQVEITFIHTESYLGTHTHIDHLQKFYTTFSRIQDQKYDGMIITGAPVEQLHFEDVAYWGELARIMDWARDHVTSTLYICWAAQAALYHRYGINKHATDEKVFGIFQHEVRKSRVPLMRGFDDAFWAPHSRHTEIRSEDIARITALEVLAESNEAGVYILASTDGREIYVTGHSEYDALTLKEEYDRDRAKGLSIEVPKHYFPDDDPTRTPSVTWRSHGSLLFANWLNYYVYQRTPFEIEDVGRS